MHKFYQIHILQLLEYWSCFHCTSVFLLWWRNWLFQEDVNRLWSSLHLSVIYSVNIVWHVDFVGETGTQWTSLSVWENWMCTAEFVFWTRIMPSEVQLYIVIAWDAAQWILLPTSIAIESAWKIGWLFLAGYCTSHNSIHPVFCDKVNRYIIPHFTSCSHAFTV